MAAALALVAAQGLRAQGFELQTVEEMAATLVPAAPAGTRKPQAQGGPHTAPARRDVA